MFSREPPGVFNYIMESSWSRDVQQDNLRRMREEEERFKASLGIVPTVQPTFKSAGELMGYNRQQLRKQQFERERAERDSLAKDLQARREQYWKDVRTDPAGLGHSWMDGQGFINYDEKKYPPGTFHPITAADAGLK